MPAIKIYLEAEELDAVERLAESLNLRTQDIGYCALNRLMLSARDPAIREDIRQTRDWHRGNLPLWSDSPLGRHAYESQPDDQPHPSEYR